MLHRLSNILAPQAPLLHSLLNNSNPSVIREKIKELLQTTFTESSLSGFLHGGGLVQLLMFLDEKELKLSAMQALDFLSKEALKYEKTTKDLVEVVEHVYAQHPKQCLEMLRDLGKQPPLFEPLKNLFAKRLFANTSALIGGPLYCLISHLPNAGIEEYFDTLLVALRKETVENEIKENTILALLTAFKQYFTHSVAISSHRFVESFCKLQRN